MHEIGANTHTLTARAQRARLFRNDFFLLLDRFFICAAGEIQFTVLLFDVRVVATI